MSSGRKSSRGTSSIAASTRSSSIPRRRSWRSTIRDRSVDVVAESSRLMHGHLSPAEGHHARPLERGEEAAGALARGARQMGDLGLGRPDQHVGLRRALGLAGDRLREKGAGNASRDRLEGLLKQPLVRPAHALGEGCEQLEREVGVAADQPLNVAGEQGDGAGRLDGLRGRRAGLAAEHGELAEERARPQLGQRDHATVLMLASEDHGARTHEVAGLARVPLSEDDLAPVPAARHRHLGDRHELRRLEIAKDLGAREQPGRILPVRHGRIIPCVALRAEHDARAVTAREVEEAAELIAGDVRETPLLAAGELGRRVGARVVLKTENLQITGSFKLRGAVNSIRRLPEEALRAGVVAASAGNHAQAVACAARDAGARALLVMPAEAPLAKVAAVRQYGGEVRFVDGGFDEAHTEARRMAEEERLTVVHAFDAPDVVAGQGTVGLEIAEAAPDVRLVVVPLGGGGLAAGIGLAVAALMQGRVSIPSSGEVCAVLSGGNVDASLLSECIRLGETAAGRRMVLSTVVPDRPGALAGLLRVVAEHGGNVVDVEHLRDGIEIHVRETAIKLVLQTRGRENNQEILDAARAEGFSVRVERDA